MKSDDALPLLLDRREAFLGFLAARLGGNQADAEDVFQNGMARALIAAPALRDDERLVPWFYQLLRRALVDHVRSRRATEARERRWTEETLKPDAVETGRHLCACLEPLVSSLPPGQAELVRRCELGLEPVSVVAASLGLTPGAASVALHRARAALRAKLAAFCGSECAGGACLDCDCEKSE